VPRSVNIVFENWVAKSHSVFCIRLVLLGLFETVVVQTVLFL
jgi:hypothetical protein